MGTDLLAIRTHPDPSKALDPAFRQAIVDLYGGFEAIRRRVGVDSLVQLEVVLTSDLTEAVRACADSVVNDEALDQFHSHRLGGIVRGITFSRDKERRRPLVILDESAVDKSSPEALATWILLISHEFAHTLILQIRASSEATLEPSWLPWRTAKWLTRYAMDEYLADIVADVVLGLKGSAATDDGQILPLSSRVVHGYSETYVDSAETGLRKLVNIIHDYRHGHLTIDEMWVQVQTGTRELLVVLAHAQAEVDAASPQEGSVTDTRGFGPLHVCWRDIHQLFRSFPPLLGPQQYGLAEPHVLNSGSKLILEFWKAMGLTFTPAGDSFHIAVAPPVGLWSGPAL